jgi:predicted enzyme related to lactoylglutathione lyase
MDVFKTPGAFSWSELTTTDPAAAAAFYGKLFGWTVKAPDPNMGGYRVVAIGEQGVAGISGMQPGAPAMPSHWGNYVTVGDIDHTTGLCESLGGKVLVPPMDVPGVGRMAVFMDPQGAVISAITYATPA